MATQEGFEAIRQQVAGLVDFPREDLGIELKNWLDLDTKHHRALLAKALLALANHGGGYVVIGFDNTTRQPAEGRPGTLEVYGQDVVNGIVKRYADPPFECIVHFPTRAADGKDYPVIWIPGSPVPVRAKRSGPDECPVKQDTYYTRVPGPESAPVPDGRAWDELIGRCVRANRDDLLDDLRRMLTGGLPKEAKPTAQEALAEWVSECMARFEDRRREAKADDVYAHGYWTAAYTIQTDGPAPSAPDFLAHLRAADDSRIGWPVWMTTLPGTRTPNLAGSEIECWLLNETTPDPGEADFWRASPQGSLFMLRGYQEDGDDQPQQFEPGTAFYFEIPIWRVGECLLHARRLALRLAASSAPIAFSVEWRGLAGRTLVPTQFARHVLPRKCSHGHVMASLDTSADDIGDRLPALTHHLTKDLYAHFEFMDVNESVVQSIVAEMRRHVPAD